MGGQLDRRDPVAWPNLVLPSHRVLNHWSSDEVADLHAADLALQDALSSRPANMRVRGAKCQFCARCASRSGHRRAAIWPGTFPTYAYPHKEIGYDRLMMGQPDEALAEFLEADRLARDSHALELAAGMVWST